MHNPLAFTNFQSRWVQFLIRQVTLQWYTQSICMIFFKCLYFQVLPAQSLVNFTLQRQQISGEYCGCIRKHNHKIVMIMPILQTGPYKREFGLS